MEQTLHPKFRALRALLSRIPHINHGGCGIAALAMYQIGKQVGMNVQLMYLYDLFSENDYDLNCKMLEGRGDRMGIPNHVVCVVDNEALDSLIKVPVGIYSYRHFVTEEFTIESLKQDLWNKKFNRKEWLPRIEMFLGYKLL